jgi:hypothetical protein
MDSILAIKYLSLKYYHIFSPFNQHFKSKQLDHFVIERPNNSSKTDET